MSNYEDSIKRQEFADSSTSTVGYAHNNLQKIRELSGALDSILVEERMRLGDINRLKERIVNLESKRNRQLRELQAERESVDTLKQKYMTEQKQFEQRIQTELQTELDKQRKLLEESHSLIQHETRLRLEKASERENELLQEIETLRNQLTRQEGAVLQQKSKYEQQLEELQECASIREVTFKEREDELRQKIEELEKNAENDRIEGTALNTSIETIHDNISKIRQDLELDRLNSLSDESRIDMGSEIGKIIQFIELQEKRIG